MSRSSSSSARARHSDDEAAQRPRATDPRCDGFMAGASFRFPSDSAAGKRTVAGGSAVTGGEAAGRATATTGPRGGRGVGWRSSRGASTTASSFCASADRGEATADPRRLAENSGATEGNQTTGSMGAAGGGAGSTGPHGGPGVADEVPDAAEETADEGAEHEVEEAAAPGSGEITSATYRTASGVHLGMPGQITCRLSSSSFAYFD